MMKKMTLALVALTVVAGACGSDDSGSDSALVAPLSAEFQAEGDLASSAEEGDCIAGKIVSGIGEDELLEKGLTPEDAGDIDDYDWSEGEADVIVGAVEDCVDIKKALQTSLEEDFSSEDAACLVDGLDGDLILEAMKLTIVDPNAEPDDRFLEAFTAAAVECRVS